MTTLTVLQTLPALNAGGVERCTLETARALVAAGHRSVVVSSGGRMVAQLLAEGSEHITLPVERKSLLTLLQVAPLRRLLETLQPDIIHARSRVPAWLAWLALRKLPAVTHPHLVTTMHGLHSVSPYSAIMTRGEAVIAGSKTVRDYILKNYPGCPPERIQLIPEGVDPQEFPYGYQPDVRWLQGWQREFPQLAGKTVLALPGRLTRLKGHALFIDLIAALQTDHSSVHGLIIGGAETGKTGYRREIEAHIAGAGLGAHITLTGHRSDMREVISQCDLVFSLSTKPESFGRTVLEAIRLGKPVIGWDLGGVGEILSACYPAGRVACAGGPDTATHQLLATTRGWLAAPTHPADSPLYRLDSMCTQTLALYRTVAGK